MATGEAYYRGGTSLKPRPFEVKLDPVTGLLRPTHGISVFNRPDHLDRFGGVYRVTGVPEELKIIQRGRDPSHFEIVPARPMTLAEYEAALGKIVLVSACRPHVEDSPMATQAQPFTIEFPEGYDAQAEFEAPYRGYLPDVTVHLEDGTRHRLTFMDLSRLEQGLADNVRMGRAYYTEPGLVILPDVSTEAIHRAVQGLWNEGYFHRTPSR